MRRFLNVLGALALIFIVTSSIALGIFMYRTNALDAECKAFVDVAVPAIGAGWSEEQLLSRATPELRESMQRDEQRSLFNKISQLGSLVEYEGSTGQATVSYMINSGSKVSASYVAKARFRNGAAVFRLVLLKYDGRWMIHNFNVEFVPGNRAGQRI